MALGPETPSIIDYMIKVYRASNITEAHIVKGMLESHGIEAYVDGFYLQGGIGELATMDFAGVSVDDNNEQQAQRLIDDYERSIDTPDDDIA